MISIRKAVAADAEQLWPMLRAVFRAADTYAVDPAISRDAALDYWMTQPAGCYVAESGGRIVGTYYIRANQPGGGAHICNCGYIVDPAARGAGIAAQMCQHSQSVAVAMGFAAMQFNFVLASNAGAVRLWQRLGFAILGTIPQAFVLPDGTGTDAHIMHKTLR